MHVYVLADSGSDHYANYVNISTQYIVMKTVLLSNTDHNTARERVKEGAR